MSAELLREAATKIRENAVAARDRFPDPLRPHGARWLATPHRARGDGTVQTEGEKLMAHYVPSGVGEHSASWDPSAALAVADQLEAMAAVIGEADGTPLAIVAAGLAEKSIALARVYLRDER